MNDDDGDILTISMARAQALLWSQGDGRQGDGRLDTEHTPLVPVAVSLSARGDASTKNCCERCLTRTACEMLIAISLHSVSAVCVTTVRSA